MSDLPPHSNGGHDDEVGVSDGRVVRGRLLGHLAERFQRRVTVIEAGAGFGKTTLLHQARAEAVEHGLGIDVLVTAPRRGLDADELVSAIIGGLRRHGDVRAAPGVDVTAVSDSIWSLAPTPCCVVIDDAQALTEDAVDTVIRLAERMPTNGHLLVVSRPSRTGLVARLVRSGAPSLDETDLAFDVDEQAAFAASRRVPFDPGRLSGWPAMLELEVRVGRSGAIEYLIDEVLSALPDEQLETCRRLAVCAAVDDETASRILGRTTTVSVETAGLPLVTRTPLPTTGGVVPASSLGVEVKLHDLLRDALLAGWTDLERRAAERRAAHVAAELGRDEEAISLFAQAGDLEAVRSIARRLAGNLHLPGTIEHRVAIGRLLRDALGDSVETDVFVAVRRVLETPQGAEDDLHRVLARARAAGDRELEAVCRLRLADLANQAADPVALGAEVELIDALAADGVRDAVRSSFLPHVWLRTITNRHDEVVEFLDQHRFVHPDLDPEMVQLADFYRLLHVAYTGHIDAALAAADRLTRLPHGLFSNRLDGFRMVQRWMLGRLTADDRRATERLVDLIHAAGQFHLFVEGAATTALFHSSAGDTCRAAQLLDRAEAELHRLPPGAWARHTVAQARAVLDLMGGDEDGAAQRLAGAVPVGGIASLPRFIYGVTAALTYVLVPSTRATWEADRAGPDHLLRRDVGRALVALRERADPSPAAGLPWEHVDALRTWAYEPHLAELALAAAESGATHAQRVVDGLRLDPRSVLHRLGSSGPVVIRDRARRLAQTMPRRPEYVLEIRVLGPIELRRDGQAVTDEAWVRRQRVRDLLALLVEHRRIDRTRAATMMWPDKDPVSAGGNFRYTLGQLQAVMEPQRGRDRPWFVRTEGADLVLTDGELLRIDVDEFGEHLRTVASAERAGRPALALEAALSACELYRGDYLAGVTTSDDAFYRGLQLRGQFVDAATRAADLLLGLGELERAEELALRAARAETGHEASHRTLADVLVAQHRPGAARDVLRPLLSTLADAGIRPDAATVSLARRLGVEV